jgi:lipid A ethanolaminephosphotransferase
MASDSVTALKARASETYTRAAVKAILSPKPSEKLYELLPNYLYRNGVDVIWRTSNWGTNPIKVKKNYTMQELGKMYPDAKNAMYDGILYHGLKEQIEESDSTKLFIGIHTYTSHGPDYFNGTPEEFKVFSPECTTVEMSKANYNHLVNAYDNTIYYTDYLVHSVIQTLKNDFPDRRSCVIFISDHGESLGEGGYYMHGAPLRFAPDEQLDIPFIVWTSDKSLQIKDLETAGHYNIFHTALRFLGMETPVYDESKDIFE